MVTDTLLPEGHGILAAKHQVQVLAGVGELLRAGQHEREVRNVDDAFKCRHLLWVDGLHCKVANEEELGFGMVYNVVYLLAVEFMEDWHRNGSVGECCQEGHSPVAGVAPTDGNLVAFGHVAVLKQYV